MGLIVGMSGMEIKCWHVGGGTGCRHIRGGTSCRHVGVGLVCMSVGVSKLEVVGRRPNYDLFLDASKLPTFDIFFQVFLSTRLG